MLLIYRTAPFVLVFVRVEVLPELLLPTVTDPKLSVDGEMAAEGLTPVPVRLAVFDPEETLSYTRKVAFRFPEPTGVNVTVIVQDALAAKLLGQLLVCE